jgi:chorismate synthase
VGCVVDGLPPRMRLSAADVQVQLDRRRPGQSAITTDRQEGDVVEICAGTENGLTLGSPLTMIVRNKDQRPGDYSEMSQVPRPSHADLTYMAKYGINASSGGGRASARETIGRVAAGAVAEVMWF